MWKATDTSTHKKGNHLFNNKYKINSNDDDDDNNNNNNNNNNNINSYNDKNNNKQYGQQIHEYQHQHVAFPTF